MSRTKRPSRRKGPVPKRVRKGLGNRPPLKRRDPLDPRRERYEAAVESARVLQAMGEGQGILDIDPCEFGLPEDYDDGERYFAHVMAKDD